MRNLNYPSIVICTIASYLFLLGCTSQNDESSSKAEIVLKSGESNGNDPMETIDKNPKKIAINSTKELNSCFDVTFRILETSPHFIETTKGLRETIIKNGGSNYGVMLEGSPNPDEDGAIDFSTSYDFQLYESYEDHSPTVERYTFDQNFKQLYLYDPVEDELIPIDFDRKLLDKMKEFCK